jgi:excisionase family DNA binding protein
MRTKPTTPRKTSSQIDQRRSDEHMSPKEVNRKQLYRVADAMVVLSISRSVIYEQMRSGRLRSVTQGRARLIPASAIADYIALLEREAKVA